MDEKKERKQGESSSLTAVFQGLLIAGGWLIGAAQRRRRKNPMLTIKTIKTHIHLSGFRLVGSRLFALFS